MLVPAKIGTCREIFCISLTTNVIDGNAVLFQGLDETLDGQKSGKYLMQEKMDQTI
jgi:hypothetical protein